MKLTHIVWACLVLALAGCGGGGSDAGTSPPTHAPEVVQPVEVPQTAPPPPALVEADESNFQEDQFEREIEEPADPVIEERPSTDVDTMAPDFFAAFNGGGEIPGAARGALTGGSIFESPAADSFAGRALFGLFGIEFLGPREIRGNVQFSDSNAHTVAVPVSFADTGLSYPNRLVYESGGNLSLESRVITYYRSGYRNDPFHERSWWAVISGEAVVNGVEGHTFAIFIEDRSNPDDPNDTRTGQDYFSITIYSPAVPYGGTFERNGMVVWGLQGVVYHNQYPLREGNIKAVNTPPEPAGGTGPVDGVIGTP